MDNCRNRKLKPRPPWSKPALGRPVRPANPLVELIGVKLERVHCVPSKALNMYAGEKSVTLCFSNGKSIHLDAEVAIDRNGVYPVIRIREGDWELIKKVEEYTDKVGYQPDEESNSVGKNLPEDKDTL